MPSRDNNYRTYLDRLRDELALATIPELLDYAKDKEDMSWENAVDEAYSIADYLLDRRGD